MRTSPPLSRLVVGLALLVAGLAVPVRPASAQPRNEEAYLFLLREGAKVKGTVGGNIGVNDAGGKLKIGRAALLATGTAAVADRVFLRADVRVFDVFANTLRFTPDKAVISGAVTRPIPPPVYVTEPLVVPDPFAPANFPPAFPITCGGPDVVSDVSGGFALTPGSYGRVTLNRGGRATLAPGTYDICDLKVDKTADLEITGPVTINVRDGFQVKSGASLIPLGTLGANDVQVNFGGTRTVRFGQASTVSARLFAPRGGLRLGRRAFVIGHFVALDLKSDKGFVAAVPHEPPTCGNGTLDGDETCDPPGAPQPPNQNVCRADCTFCGDGLVQAGEECDDGNDVDTDTCRNDCTGTSPPTCGDGILDGDETCDPPGAPQPPNQNVCRADCTFCGDGLVQAGEECDDGNDVDTDTCRNDCTLPPPACDLTVEKTCVVQPAPSAGDDCQGGVVSMTFEYTGESCAATTNQQSGKVVCSGNAAGAEPVRVVLTADVSAATVSPSTETIDVGETVTIAATGGKLKADAKFDVRQGASVRQSLSIHTSCSQPLNVGDRFGSMRLVSLTSTNGGTVTLPEPPVPAESCEAPAAPPPPHCEGKVRVLTLRYVGGDCTITNTQSGKATCSGIAGTAEPVRVVITRDTSTVVASPSTETIELGDTFTISRSPELRADTEFDIRQGSTTLQHLKIHTSCSQPLDLGDRFGAVEVVGVDSTLGGPATLGAAVEYRYTLTNGGADPIVDVVLVDDQLGEVPGSPIASIAPGETIVLTASAVVEVDTTNVVNVTGESAGESCEVVDSATVTVVEPPTPPAACASGKKVASIVLRYTGEGCSAGNNPQGGKATCTGGASFAQPVRILIRDKADGSIVYGDQSGVALNGKVSGTAANANRTEFRADTMARIFNAGGGLIEEDVFHTSCSQPLAVGDRFGSLEVTGLGLTP
jgi:cysteine-rich repeat protein